MTLTRDVIKAIFESEVINTEQAILLASGQLIKSKICYDEILNRFYTIHDQKLIPIYPLIDGEYVAINLWSEIPTRS